MTFMHTLFALCLAALAAAASPPPAFPAQATLTEKLGFRTKPSLDGPFVFPARNYLLVGTRLRLLDSKPAFGSPGAFCKAEADGRQGYIRCDKPSAFHFAAAATPPPTAKQQTAQPTAPATRP